MQIFCVYNRESLLVAIPLMFHKARYTTLKVKQACLLGSNWGVQDLAVNNQLDGWAELFLSWLCNEKFHKWDILKVGPFDPSSQHCNTLVHSIKKMRLPYKLHQKSVPYLLMTNTWKEFLSQQSRNFRRITKKKEMMAYGNGKLTKRRILNPVADQIKNTVFEVTKKSWQGNEGSAISSSRQGQRFYTLLSSTNGEFDVDLSLIYSDDKCIAYMLGIIYRNRYYAFDTGFDPDFSDYSPGFLVHLNVLQSLTENNTVEFDFGHEHSYKKRFKPLSRGSLEIVAFRRQLLARWVRLMDSLKIFRKHKPANVSITWPSSTPPW